MFAAIKRVTKLPIPNILLQMEKLKLALGQMAFKTDFMKV